MKSYTYRYKHELKSLWQIGEHEICSLNGLRAISAIGIFFFHTWSGLLSHDTSMPGALEFIKINLFAFVDLFFVLSGFLVYGTLHREYLKSGSIGLGQFFKKRALRILPAYYFYMIIAFVMLATKIQKLESLPALTQPQNVMLAQYYMARIHNLFDFTYMSDYFLGIHPHSWSLAIEFKFYILLPFFVPLLLKLNNHKRMLTLGLVYFLPLVFRILAHTYNHNMPESFAPYIYEGAGSPHIRHQAGGSIYHFFHTRFDALVLGMIVYELFTNYKQLFTKAINKQIICGASLLLTALAFTGFFDGSPLAQNTFKYNAFNISFAGLILSALIGPIAWIKFWSLRIWTPLARISYSFYLWNLVGSAIAIQYIFKKGMHKAPWQDVAIGFTGGFLQTLFISLLVFALIEAPFLALKRKST